MSLSEIAFEQIKDEYYWGCYGKFRVIVNKSTSYVNATHLVGMATNKNGNKKELFTWKQNTAAVELIDKLSAYLGMPRDTLLIIPQGLPNELRGTYAHPKLIPHIAMWASVDFAIKVSEIVNAHIVCEYKESIRVKDQTIDRLERQIADIKSQNDEQTRKINELLGYTKEMKNTLDYAVEELTDTRTDVVVINDLLIDTAASQVETDIKVDTISEKLNIAVERRVPLDPVTDRNEILSVMRIPKTDSYRAFRCQIKSAPATRRKLKDQGYTECIYNRETPNAINIWNRVRESIPADIGIIKGNNIIAPSRVKLIKFIREVEAEKANV